MDRKANDPINVAKKNPDSGPMLEVDDRNMLTTDEGNMQGSKVSSIIETYTNSLFDSFRIIIEINAQSTLYTEVIFCSSRNSSWYWKT